MSNDTDIWFDIKIGSKWCTGKGVYKEKVRASSSGQMSSVIGFNREDIPILVGMFEESLEEVLKERQG